VGRLCVQPLGPVEKSSIRQRPHSRSDGSALARLGETAVTAITVQDTRGVHGVHPVPPNIVREQIERLLLTHESYFVNGPRVTVSWRKPD